MILNNEIWKDIPQYEGLYQASNFGRIKSLERYNYKGHHNLERILKQTKCKNGYYYVALCKDKKVKSISVHRLIATTFLENPNNFLCINHIDGNKLNNNVENLEFCSYNHNNIEAYKLGLKKTVPTNQYDLNGTFIRIWKSREEIKRELGLNPSDIWRACEGQRNTCGGYIWRYANE